MKTIKNILIIIANPVEESFSFAMANAYKKKSLEQGDKVEVLDLYRDENQQDFYLREEFQTKEMDYYQAKISKADELVFVFPYWWGSMPAILKNFIDWNFSSGFAFKYVNSRPIGLLKNKKVKILATSGAPYLYYFLTGANRRLKNMFKQQIINLTGMKLEVFKLYGSMDTKNRNTQKILVNIEQGNL